ncbi:putative UDP-glucose epimerase YtcB [Pilimelia anulata]|uniref:Putative UDP-glucose epimerase YtcB n=1 Tax=Pilimelia anulata TaxID=53371 RepID=A0A8J3BIS9_9ACTN|nr:NAD-dependent epimerase/dehydratase family protein [Pilimelia anulata]GGK06753.1 putative UDP-glucose epimerase YtcB [Pilimelia anulata]
MTAVDRIPESLVGRRVVVTGAAGFVGRHVAAALHAGGAAVTGVDRAWLAAGPGAAEPPYRWVAADLRAADPDLLAGADAVLHLAALPGVYPSWRRFEAYVADNVLATGRLLDAAVAAGVPRLVLASSSSVYGAAPAGPVAEEAELRPLSPYGVTKLAAERLALAHAARLDAALTVVALRYFTVYGPGQRPDMLIRRAIDAALTGGTLEVYGDGGHRRDFVYVGDVVGATLRAAAAPLPSQAINVGTGGHVSVAEVLDRIGELVGRPVAVRHRARRSGDVPATHADRGRAARLLGWRPATGLAAGLRAQVAERAASLGVRLPAGAGPQ